MNRYIDADAFIEDIKTEAMNLFWDGMKGTPRPRKELYDIILYYKENYFEEGASSKRRLQGMLFWCIAPFEKFIL